VPGPRGGFQLVRPASIMLLDIITAIEGPGDLFHCDQILAKAPVHEGVDYRQSCALAQAMSAAGTRLAARACRVGRRRTLTPRSPQGSVPMPTNGFIGPRLIELLIWRGVRTLALWYVSSKFAHWSWERCGHLRK
jgi:hypothetical protein